jgi:hypothetical protein
MADNVTIRVKGGEKAIKDIDAYYKKKQPSVEKAIIKTLFKIERDAKGSVPVMYGRLQSSITSSWSRNGPDHSHREGVARPDAKKDRFTGVCGTNVKYAHMQEFGWWGDAPKPDKGDYPSKRGHVPAERPKEGFLYLTKAYEKHKDDPAREIRRIFKKK